MSSNLRTKNITYDELSLAFLFGADDWSKNVSWNASNVAQDGHLGLLERHVRAHLPEPAIAFRYYGLRPSQGGLYRICIDCGAGGDRQFEIIDALNASSDGTNPPVILFSKTFDTPEKHDITLENLNDTRIVPEGFSEITLDRFELDVIDDDDPFKTSSTSTSPSTSSPPGSLSPTNATNTPSTGSSSSSPTVATVIGVAIGGFVLAVILIVVVFRWRRRRNHLTSMHDPHTTAGEATIVPFPHIHSSVPKQGRSKAGSTSPPHPASTPTTSPPSLSIMSYFNFRREQRREMDAGPVPLDDDNATLPPLYEQVFRAGASNSPPSGQIPDDTASVAVRDTSK
ncbi:hypothetical protein AAF712_011646 [Marasmius tenuissimus]|uniref:Uncharacterized protein n=1 Tax=Marasmius tenuissimus TaxID=585030 RepID=A0ABR2ZLA8_9AGAR